MTPTTTMQVQVLSTSSSLSTNVDEPLSSSWNTNNQQHSNYDTTSASSSTLFKEQHPLRMISDNDSEDEEKDDLNVHHDDHNDNSTTQMHLCTNMEHLTLRDDYLNNIIQEDSSITFHNIMSNPNKIITLTDEAGSSSITICDGNSSSSTTTTSKATTTTANTTTFITSTTRMRGNRSLQNNRKSSPPKNMDSMPYPMIPVPSIVMSKSESYDALFTSSSSSSSSSTSASATATAGGEITAEGGSSSSSKSNDKDLPISGHSAKDKDDENETEWYPDSPTTVATDVQALPSPNSTNNIGSNTPKCMPEMITTTSKEKSMAKEDATSASSCTHPERERSEFLKSQHQLEKKNLFKECFKLFFKGKRGELISPLNDLSINDESNDVVKDEAVVVTMVVEISKGTKAKMFCDVSQAYHPIVQDISIDTGKLSYMDSPFYWNLGFIPQTLILAGCARRSRPLSIIEISSETKLPLGSVTKVKVLGALGILHSSEEVVDWKILCIRSNDSSFDKYNDIQDVPIYIQCGIREWFRWNTSSSSSSSSEQIQFANNENYQSKNFAIQLIQNAHITWKNNLTFLK